MLSGEIHERCLLTEPSYVRAYCTTVVYSPAPSLLFVLPCIFAQAVDICLSCEHMLGTRLGMEKSRLLSSTTKVILLKQYCTPIDLFSALHCLKYFEL